MMSVHEIVVDVQTNWMLYVSMPFVAATIGYVTKLVAIRMMFEPIEFIGIKAPYLGWQGIVPRKAAVMAGIAVDTMTRDLLKPEDIFNRLDAKRITKEIEKPLMASVEEIVRQVAGQFQPGLWEAIPESLRQAIIKRVQAEAPAVVETMMADIQGNITAVFDLKDMVITNLMRDKALLNRIFQEAGHGEFKFIAHSGIYFGFCIGCVQAITWALTHSPLVMPVFGLFTGWFTDWLALKMVFRPKYPTKYLFGLFEWQGLFLKRRKEVAADYGRLIAAEIVTPSAIINALLKGPLSDRLFNLVQKITQKMIDEQAGRAKPIVVFAVGSTKYQEMKKVISEKVFSILPETLKHMEAYAEDAMDLQNTLVERMQTLSEDQFEQLIRPAFEQDEWILIAVGAALGFLVGEMQVFVMEHLAKGAHPAKEAAVSLLMQVGMT